MKVESLIFGIIAFFCVAAAVVYGFWAQEPIGTTALVLSGGLTGLIGGFFWFVSRRIDARPEDRKDAEIADGAGELGFFSPASYWPFALALSAAIDGPGAGVLVLLADRHRRRRAARHHRRPAVRVLRGAERHPELTLAARPRAPPARGGALRRPAAPVAGCATASAVWRRHGVELAAGRTLGAPAAVPRAPLWACSGARGASQDRRSAQRRGPRGDDVRRGSAAPAGGRAGRGSVAGADRAAHDVWRSEVVPRGERCRTPGASSSPRSESSRAGRTERRAATGGDCGAADMQQGPGGVHRGPAGALSRATVSRAAPADGRRRGRPPSADGRRRSARGRSRRRRARGPRRAARARPAPAPRSGEKKPADGPAGAADLVHLLGHRRAAVGEHAVAVARPPGRAAGAPR